MREKLKSFTAIDHRGIKRNSEDFLGKNLYLVFNRGFI